MPDENIMTVEKLSAQLLDETPPAEPIIPAGDPPAGDPPPPPPPPGSDPPPPPPPGGEFIPTYKPVWEKLAKDGIKIPEAFLKGTFGDGKDETQALIETIIENTAVPGEDDPFIQKYLSTPPEKRGELMKEYTETANIYNLPPDEGLERYYKTQVNDKGELLFKEDDVKDYVGKMNPIERMQQWESAKSKMKEQEVVQNKGVIEQRQKDYLAQVETTNVSRQKLIELALADEDTINDLDGIPYTPEMKKEFKTLFTAANLINPKSGQSYFQDLIASDDKVLRDVIRAYATRKDNKLKAHLTSFKEDFKTGILDSLDLNPRQSGGAAQFTVAQKPEDMV